MKAILDSQATLGVKTSIQSLRDALEITDTVDNVLPNEGLDIASECITLALEMLSELINEHWGSADWVTRQKYKQILKAAEKDSRK